MLRRGPGLDLAVTTSDIASATSEVSLRRAMLLSIEQLSVAGTQLQASVVSFINFAGLIAVGGLTIGLGDSSSPFLLFVPFGLAIVLTYLVQLYTDLERLTTLRECLEERINDHYKRPVFLATAEGANRHRGRASVRLVALVNGTFLVSFSVVSVASSKNLKIQLLDIGAFWPNIIGLGVVGSTLIISVCEMLRAGKLAKADFEGVVDEYPSPPGESAGTTSLSVSVKQRIADEDSGVVVSDLPRRNSPS